MQLGARRVLEESGSVLTLALLHPVAVHAERTTVDDLKRKCKKAFVINQLCMLLTYKKAY